VIQCEGEKCRTDSATGHARQIGDLVNHSGVLVGLTVH